MSGEAPRGDLIVLVPCSNMEHALLGLLSRGESLAIRPVTYRILKHPQRDPGCRLRGVDLLRQFAGKYRHALVLLDREGSGEETLSRSALEDEIEGRLRESGWGDQAAAVVLEPELEVWVWSDSPEVDRILGWQGRDPPLRTWLVRQGLLAEGQPKPARPKDAFERALYQVRKPPSSAVFRQLAETVSLRRCEDPAFLKLRDVLRRWFGQG